MNGRQIELRGVIEILGVVGLIASLVFVALEIRQNTNAVRGATIQGFAEQSLEVAMQLTQSPDLRAAFLSMNDDELTDDQRLILGAYFTGTMRILENRLIQAELGTIDHADLERFGARSTAYRQPFFRVFWESRKEQYSTEFQEYVDREIISLSTVPVLPDEDF